MSGQLLPAELTSIGHFLNDVREAGEAHGVRIAFEFYVQVNDGTTMRVSYGENAEDYLVETSG